MHCAGKLRLKIRGAAIAIMKRSLEEVGIDLSSYKMDIDIIMTGRPKSIRDRLSIVLSTLMNMEKATGIVEKDALVNELETKSKIPRGEVERMISQLLREGTIYEPREGLPKENLNRRFQKEEALTRCKLSFYPLLCVFPQPAARVFPQSAADA